VKADRYQFDAAYVDKLVAGDAETERHFTSYFGELLRLKLRFRLRSAAQIEDARQETFVRVLSALRSGRGLHAAENLGAYVNGVCNNVLFELYRSNSRTQALGGEYDPPENRPAPDSALIAVEERGRVRAALAALPQREQDLLRWLFFEERDKDEICREMQIDRNYLRVLLHRARKQFRDRFGEL
jgi:RNA polymerase sigma-70 factor, ECF subfamily